MIERKPIDQATIKENLNYDPDTGVFTRRIAKSNSVKIGNVAGCIGSNGYITLRLNNVLYLAHRLAFIYVHGDDTGLNYIDHIDGNPSNNKITNLRSGTQSENMQNRKKCQINNKSSGLLGVCFHNGTNKFMAEIKANEKKIYLGLFNTPEEAHQAYLNKKRQIHSHNTL